MFSSINFDSIETCVSKHFVQHAVDYTNNMHGRRLPSLLKGPP